MNTKTNLIFATLIIIATILALIMLPSNVKSFIPNVNAQSKQEVKMKCDVNCKIKVLEDMKFNPDLAYHIVWSCKNNAKDPVHCIKYASAVSMAESSGGWHCVHKYNCFGMGDGKKDYGFKSYKDAVMDWVTRYNKYWYKANNGEFFYGASAKKPAKSRYCMSEASSRTQGWCPNGRNTSNSIIKKLNSKF